MIGSFFIGGLIQTSVGLSGGFWWFFDEAFGIRSIGKIEDFLSGDVDFISLSIVDLVGASSVRFLHDDDHDYTSRKNSGQNNIFASSMQPNRFGNCGCYFRVLKQLSENGLSLEVWGLLCDLVTPRSASIKSRSLGLHRRRRDRHAGVS